MAKSVKFTIFKSPYFLFSIISLLLFIGITWYVWRDVEKESLRRANIIIKDLAVSNLNVVKSIVKEYDEEFSHIQHILKVKNNEELLEETFLYIKEQDTTIRDIKIITSEDYESIKSSLSLQEEFKELHFSRVINQNKILLMVVDIPKLHHKISERKDLLHAYVTIVLQGRYIFHPDERMLGKKVIKTTEYPQKSIYKAYSTFLNLEVYCYDEIEIINNSEWIFTANILKLDFQEYVEKRAKALFWILLTALLSFLLIVSMGVLRWHKEFAKRKNVEQQNLTLALKNEQQKQASLSTELEILKSGLNPHFLFNAMSSLKILVNKKPELAKSFAVMLSNVYRYMLKHEKENTVTLSEELYFVRDYIELQKIRFGDKVQLDVKINPNLLPKRVPPVSVQLLVENAIKHTVISESKPLQIEISIEEDNLVVKNNYHPRVSKIEHSGKGIENLQKRYSLLTFKNCYFYISDDNYIAKIPLLETESLIK